MREIFATTLLIAASAAVSVAAQPVGKLSATEGVSVSGTAISFRGIPTWPVVAGVEIRTSSAMAMLILNDGSLFRIAPASAVRIESAAGKQTVRVVDGAMQISKTTGGTAVASRKGVVTAEVGVLRADSSNVVAGPAGVESNMIRYELPAPSRRR